MEESNLQPAEPEVIGDAGSPKAPVAPPFAASETERISAFLMYALAYLYIWMLLPGGRDARILIVCFTLGFVALTEYLHRDAPRSRESWVWLGCTAAILLSIALRRHSVWEYGEPVLFLHIFAVWWALSRTGTLLEGESGRLLPLDAIDAFLAFPFKHFLLRLRTVGFTLSRLRSGEKKAKPETVVWTVAALAAATALFVTAAGLLMRADSGFADLLSGFTGLFRIELDWEITMRLMLSLPVGAYLFGLLAGTGREDRAALRARGEAVCRSIEGLRKVPSAVWTLLTALFCLLYLAFFIVQGRYLFGAFRRTLPAGFIVSEYARRGFFELCRVMAVNFVLLWLVTRTSRGDARSDRAVSALCLALLAESLLLAVVALSKLWLYIDCFGFTPKRLQSTWLVCVLAFGCVCAALSLARGKKTFRVWMVFGAATLSLLCLY